MNILLAIDNSPHSKVAIDVVANRVWPKGSHIKVFCAVERREPVFAVMTKSEATAFHSKALYAAEHFTGETADLLAEKFPDCIVSNEVNFGDSKEYILVHATQWPADLIVVGSHGRHGLPRLFLGSVSQTILLHSPCPTLIARYPQGRQDEMGKEKNILIAVDDSDHSRKAFDWVTRMPWAEDAQFMLVSAIPSLVEKYADGIYPHYASHSSEERVEETRVVQEFLGSCVATLTAKIGPGRVRSQFREGDAATEIMTVANSWDADLVVMGSQSRGTMNRLFMGSVSQEVVLQAPCPIAVIK